MDLNLTSTNPSVIDALAFIHQGNVPLPDCFRTFGLLGADASALTAHFGEPCPVTPQVQSAGGVPSWALSNVSISANAAVAIATIAGVSRAILIGSSRLLIRDRRPR